MYLMRKVTKRSYAKIGSYFSGRDAKTTRHACHMTERRLIEDPALQSLVNEIDQRWRLVGGRPGLAPETNSRLK
jgi:chromosomal replication initiation ATPase DnaA